MTQHTNTFNTPNTYCITHLLTCPLCQMHFTKIGNTVKCASGHSFDIAKEGYVNLLTRKLAATVGDTKEMLQARRAFLEQGHYQPLSNLLNEIVTAYLHDEERENDELPHTTLLDIGCGEGYYIGRLQQQLVQGFPTAHFCTMGLDIARDALRMAAKRYKATQFVVADAKERLVFASNAFHVLLNIFAPRNIDEFARVLMPGGLLIVVIPQAHHLQQLRSHLHLLGIEEQKEQHVIHQCTASGHFTLLATRTLTYEITLQGEEIAQAIMMTPNYWHLSAEISAAMHNIEQLRTDVGFTCVVLQRVCAI